MFQMNLLPPSSGHNSISHREEMVWIGRRRIRKGALSEPTGARKVM
jgi:hypothetical protein